MSREHGGWSNLCASRPNAIPLHGLTRTGCRPAAGDGAGRADRQRSHALSNGSLIRGTGPYARKIVMLLFKEIQIQTTNTELLPTIIQKQYLCEPQEITSSHNICELNDLDCAVTGNTFLWAKPFGLGYLYRRGFSFTCNRCEYIWEETRNALDRWVR
jgi:hypothetical protein